MNITELKTLVFEMAGSDYHRIEVADAVWTTNIVPKVTSIFVEKHFDGSNRAIYPLDTSAGTFSYTLPDSVDNVVSILNMNSSGMGADGSVRKLIYESGQMRGDPADSSIVDYTQFLAQMSLFDIVYKKHYHFDFNKLTHTFSLLTKTAVQNPLYLEIYTDASTSQAESLYDSWLFQDMCLAQVQIAWARSLKKYNRALIGGSDLNWSEIETEGQELWEKCLETIENDFSNQPEIEFG